MIHIPDKIPFRRASDGFAEDTHVIETPFGIGRLAEQRADTLGDGEIVVTDVIHLDCGATLYRPSAGTAAQSHGDGRHRRHKSELALSFTEKVSIRRPRANTMEADEPQWKQHNRAALPGIDTLAVFAEKNSTFGHSQSYVNLAIEDTGNEEQESTFPNKNEEEGEDYLVFDFNEMEETLDEPPLTDDMFHPLAGLYSGPPRRVASILNMAAEPVVN